MSDSDSSEENVIVRRQRIFRKRTCSEIKENNRKKKLNIEINLINNQTLPFCLLFIFITIGILKTPRYFSLENLLSNPFFP